MKIRITILMICSIIGSFTMFGQAPQSFNYQAVARNTSGEVLANQSVSFQISILEGSAAGAAVYTETHTATTNQLGLVSLAIGSGTIVSGVFGDITWESNSYFLQIEMDENGGDNYLLMGTSQLLSVPYAISSISAERSNSLIITSPGGSEFEVIVDEYGNLSTQNTNPECVSPFTDSRDGQNYETVQIGEQCWMAENLNIGSKIDGIEEQTDNTTIEKYCYDDLESNCDTYGGLYQWNEMMEYTTTEGVQGICPSGWHIPKEAEWCLVTQEIDPTVDCYTAAWVGTYVGLYMKSSTGWDGTNESGFTALPCGYRSNGSFYVLGWDAYFWSSKKYLSNEAWFRGLATNYGGVLASNLDKNQGFSVRCVKD